VWCVYVCVCEWVCPDLHIQSWASYGLVVLDLTVTGQIAGWEGGRGFVHVSCLVHWRPTRTLPGSLAYPEGHSWQIVPLTLLKAFCCMETVLANACGVVIDNLPSIARCDGANEKNALLAETGCTAASDRNGLLK
jgi:hypothetical protein